MEMEILIPTIHVFVHTHEFWTGRVEQNAAWGEACRTQVLERFGWLDRELEGREFIAAGDYTVADITAQCGVLLGKANALRVPAELKNLTAWWDRVAARPSARA